MVGSSFVLSLRFIFCLVSEIDFNTPTRMHPKQAVQAKPKNCRERVGRFGVVREMEPEDFS